MQKLIQIQLKGNMDEEVYAIEYGTISEELKTARQEEKSEFDKISIGRAEYKNRVDEIIEVLNGKEGLLQEFDEDIFNALVEKIEVLSPTHFVFVLKNGMRVEEKIK